MDPVLAIVGPTATGKSALAMALAERLGGEIVNADAQSRSLGNCFADISKHVDTKLAAIACHKSQLPKLDLESSRDLARAMGRISGYEYAEAYEVLRVRV